MTIEHKPTIRERILESVRTATPHSRRYFKLRNISMWALAALSIVLGSLSISSILFRTINATMALGPKPPPIPDVFIIVPYVWIILLGAFSYLAYLEVRNTERGYKYELWALILGMILASCVLGMAFFATGVGSTLDRAASHVFPFHPSLERVQEGRWMNPEGGFLIGVVTKDALEDAVLLTDPKQIVWKVVFAQTLDTSALETVKQGVRIGVRGKILDPKEKVFLACSIRSLEFSGRGPMPPNRAPFLQQAERKNSEVRSTECEDVRPLD